MERTSDPSARLQATWKRALARISETYSQVEPSFQIMGAFGVLGFPLYYFVWAYLFPQPYENLSLRLIGAALCVPLLLVGQLPARLRNGFRIYWYVIMTYNFPIFFT